MSRCAEKPLIDNGDKYKEYKKTTYDCYIYRTNQGALEMYVQLLNDGVKPYLNVNVDEIINKDNLEDFNV